MIYSQGDVQFNTINSSMITERTLSGFEGEPVQLPITLGRRGPFFHVSSRKLGGTGNELIKRYKKYATHSRSKLISKFGRKRSKGYPTLEIFLSEYESKIEMDPNFSLLNDILIFFEERYYPVVKKLYERVSYGRWLGSTKPNSFHEANCLVNLDHLKKYQQVVLYKIWIDVPRGIQNLKPMLLIGNVKDGTSIQYKMNNHAIACISEVSLITDNWDGQIIK